MILKKSIFQIVKNRYQMYKNKWQSTKIFLTKENIIYKIIFYTNIKKVILVIQIYINKINIDLVNYIIWNKKINFFNTYFKQSFYYLIRLYILILLFIII